MFMRIIPAGLHVETERAVAGALTAVDDLHAAYARESVHPDGASETIVLVATPNDSLADVVRQVTEAMVRARRVRVEAPTAA